MPASSIVPHSPLLQPTMSLLIRYCLPKPQTAPAIPWLGPVIPFPLVSIFPAPVVLDVASKKNVPVVLTLELDIVIEGFLRIRVVGNIR